MRRFLIAVAALLLAAPFSAKTQSAAQTNGAVPASDHEARGLMKSAHNSEQYKHLAAYFHQREADYRAKAAAEKIERDRRLQVNAGLEQKYPRPADSAQYLYESYLSDADMSAALARRYDQLAAHPAQPGQQIAITSPGRS